MNKSFYIGLTGEVSKQYGIDIISDNISNINTIGFKRSSTNFSSLFTSTLTDAYTDSTLNDAGLGAQQNGTTLDTNQGVFQFTDRAFDLAIGGEGWFGVKGKTNQANDLYYTRAGSFSRDVDGNMVDPNGNYLLGTLGGNMTSTSLDQKTLENFGQYYGKSSTQLGKAYSVSEVNNIPLGAVSSQTKINLPDILYFPPVPTTNLVYHANLDPKINISYADLTLNAADINSTIDTSNKTISVNGTISNTPAITNAVEGDGVLVTITDINGITKTVNTTLDANLNWTIPDENISSLDTTNPITVTAKALTVQLSNTDITSNINTINQTISIDGTVSNTPEVQNAKVGDYVQITMTDASGKIVQASTQLTYPKGLTTLSSTDIVSNIDTTNKTISINGTTSNTPEASSAKVGDTVFITITDVNGNVVNTQASINQNLEWTLTNEDISSLDTTGTLSVSANAEIAQINSNNLIWTLSNKDISTLDTANPITTTAQLQTLQEIPNVEHFTSTIISPTGTKDILDMTYTKRVPQPANGSTWDGTIKILSFFEKYNPNTTYDTNIYQVDKTAEKVYKIVDSQSATVSFDGSGQLLSSDVPVMSNSGTPLSIDVGSPNSFTGFVSNSNLNINRSSYEKEPVGTVSGMLTQYGMDGNGNVIAEFNNGKSVALAKVAVYHFQNDQGLSKTTSTLFQESSNSGKPIFYTDANGNFVQGSKIFGNRLESSNVDMTVALTELIAFQRTFDASSKILTTSDQMIQNAINMKK